jgi:hypothetical protein
MTVLDLTTEALQVCNIIGQADTPKDAQTTNAFRALIGLVDTSNADPLKQLTTARRNFTLVPPRQIYTIGPDSSMDINAPRPAKILRANLIDLTSSPNPPYNPMMILDWDGYQSYRLRETMTQIPYSLWYDGLDIPIPNPVDPPENDLVPVAGFGNIVLPFVPTAPNVIEFWAAYPLTQASSLFDDLVFPAGYYEYLLYGTCVRLYPRYGRDISQAVADLYTAARLLVESANSTPGPVVAMDSGLPSRGGGYWDGRTNTFLGRSGVR